MEFAPGTIVRSRFRHGNQVVFLMVLDNQTQTPKPKQFNAVVLENLDPDGLEKKGSTSNEWLTENFVQSSLGEIVFACGL